MFIIEAEHINGRRWVAGIFAEHCSASVFLDSIPGQERCSYRLMEHTDLNYPFFIIESDHFEYGDITFAEATLQSIQPQGNADCIHCNLYIVHEDFAPPKPGTDYMGVLYHWHVDDQSLNLLQTELFSKLENLLSNHLKD